VGYRTCLDRRAENNVNEEGSGMNIEFLATVAVIAPDPPVSRTPYVHVLGLPLEGPASST
jgi:hypothetical protein